MKIFKKQLNFIDPKIFKIIITWFLVTRICLLLIGGTAQLLYSTSYLGFFTDKNLSQNAFVMSPFVKVWATWDSIYYYRIAEEGYPDIKEKQVDLKTSRRFAFFPLYPVFIRILSALSGLNLYLSGLVISNICLIASCILMYKLLLLDYSRRTALQAVKFMLIAPTSFIFSGYFTESIYFFFLLLSFWLARQQNWLMVGMTGMLLSLTRVPGVLAVLPLGIIAWEQSSLNKENLKRRILKLLPLMLLPVGLGIYILVNYLKTGDPLFFFHIQETWGRQIRNILMSLPLELINAIKNNRINRVVETGATITALSLVVIGFRRMRPEYRIFCLYSIIVPLLTSTWSMPRFLLPIFPLYLCLDFICVKRWMRDLMTIVLAMTMGFLMVTWSTGGKLVI